MPTITISGQAGTGKTTIAKIIQEALHREGFAVEIPEEEQEEMDNIDDERFRNQLVALRVREPIQLRTTQAPRTPNQEPWMSEQHTVIGIDHAQAESFSVALKTLTNKGFIVDPVRLKELQDLAKSRRRWKLLRSKPVIKIQTS